MPAKIPPSPDILDDELLREMARCLSVAPISPAELRRRSRVSLADLRGFLQACLFLGQVHWVPTPRS